MARSSLLPLGSVVADRFEILRLVGSGGMGHVYRARDRATGKPVAIKVLHGEASIAGRSRFEREAALLEALGHPGVVRHVAFGVLGPQGDGAAPLYLAMEWIEGEDLGAHLARGPLAPADALAMAVRLAEALGAAHRLGVVHRDVKPGNILLEAGDPRRPRLADFGIAGGGAVDARSLTATGATLGTPGFMAPEQIRSEAPPGPAADVFSVGCVLWNALVGREPFGGGSVVATLARVLFEPTPRLREAWPEAPEALDELCGRLLSREPEERPRDGEALAAELAALGVLTLRSGSLRPRAAPTALGEREQRLLSAILVLTGGAQAEGTVREELPADPEATLVAQPLASLEVLGGLARSFGAELEPVHGAAYLVAVRGESVATDLAVRAARCALALRRELPGAALAVTTGRGTSRSGASLGEVSDRAAALLDRWGGAGGIVLDETTAGLVSERLEVERRGATPPPDAATGELSACWILVGERASWLGVRPVLGSVRPCVGRERELGSLRVVAEEAFDEPCARACVLLGGAGFGKSRLRAELLRRLEADGRTFGVWAARGDELAAGAPLALVGELIRAAAGVEAGAPPDAARRRLLALAAGAGGGEAEVETRAAFLGEMAGAPLARGERPEIDRARLDPALMGDQLRRAFVDVALAASGQQPLVLVLEDFQWGDLPSHELVEAALVELAEQPILAIVTARPEAQRVFPALFARAQPWQVRVGPLTPRAAQELVRGLLGVAGEDVVARFVEGGAGQPLLLEEIARAALEDGGSRDARPLATLPESVVAMVQARIEVLPAFDRKVLRAASVFGRAFWEGAVGRLVGGADEGGAGGTLGASLDRLVGREWLEPRARSRFPDERELAFRQDVVREAAYAMLTELDRRLGHRLAGEWLEAGGEEPLVLARHFDAGGEGERAAGFFAAAAEAGLESGDFGGAVAHGARAVELGARGEALGGVRAVQAEASLLRGENAEAVRFGREALERSPIGSLPWLRASAATASAAGKLGDADTVVAVAEGLLSVPPELATSAPYAAACSPTVIQLLIAGRKAEAERLASHLARGAPAGAAVGAGLPDDAEVAAFAGHLARALGAVRAFTGDPWGSVQLTRRAVPCFERAGDPRLACLLAKTLGWYEGELGALEEAEATLRRALDRATELRLLAVIPHAKHDLGSPLLRLGKLDEAWRLQEEAAATFAAQGDRRLESGARALLAAVAIARGEGPRAVELARAALAAAPSDPVRIAAIAQLAAAELASGDAAAARRTADEGLALLEAVGVTEEGVPLLRLTHAEALTVLGDEAGARAGLAVALAELREKAARIGDEPARARFLERIEENARTLALAGRLGLA